MNYLRPWPSSRHLTSYYQAAAHARSWNHNEEDCGYGSAAMSSEPLNGGAGQGSALETGVTRLFQNLAQIEDQHKQ